jgi:hypothetical protein
MPSKSANVKFEKQYEGGTTAQKKKAGRKGDKAAAKKD